MFCKLIILCLLNCIFETILVTEGHNYFSQGPHFGQHLSYELFI